jgi:predicted unusual protein kinase regulating ubiquinone biosynthesis (AarF/ABC1/UbiB family)
MNRPNLRARYWRILTFFARSVASVYFMDITLSRLGLRGWSQRSRPGRYRRIARQFRALAISMGGVMIKVGQFLSSRLDVLPVEITEELSGLQDEVPPEDFEAIRQLAESELGGPLEVRFERFEPLPLAAASLGQVHRARLCVEQEGQETYCEVVVKIQRPFIDQLIEVDLKAIRQVGAWLERYKPIRRRVDVRALVGEFSDTIRQEIDYLAEGKNAETFAENFKQVPRVHVPRVVWSHTTAKVLTLEDVFAIKITDFEAITAAGIDRAEVAKALLSTYMQQIFEDGFFHADPHPGNLFVTPGPAAPGKKQDWQLTFVDFGMVGHVPDNLREGLRELLAAVGRRDAARVVRAYQTLGMLLPGADLRLIEQAEAALFDRFWGKSMQELRQVSHREMYQFANQFRELMYEMPFQVPNNLLMLVRTVAILSGMCTGLDPQFNLWSQLTPLAQKLVTEELGENWRVWLDKAGELLQELIALPSQLGRVLGRAERGDLAVQVPQLHSQTAALEAALNRLSASVILAALVLGGVLFVNNGNLVYGRILLTGALLDLVWLLLFSRRRHY